MSEEHGCKNGEHVFGDYSDLGLEEIHCMNCRAMSGVGLDGYDAAYSYYSKKYYPKGELIKGFVINGKWVTEEQWRAHMSKLGRLLHE